MKQSPDDKLLPPNQPKNVPQRAVCSICGAWYEGHGNNAQPLNDGLCCDHCNALVTLRRINDETGHNHPPGELLELLRFLAKGAEPFWMQDVRRAQRALEGQRQSAARARDQAASSSEEESSAG